LRLVVIEPNEDLFILNDAKDTIIGYLDDHDPYIYIPSQNKGYTISKIADFAFYNHKHRQVIIDEGIIDIGNYAFANNYLLTSIKFPNTIRSIGKHAFYNHSLYNLTLPDSLVTIDDFAFYSDNFFSLLKDVKIPHNVSYLGVNAFNYRKLKYVSLSDNRTYKFESSTILTKDGKTLIAYVGDKVNLNKINTVEEIGAYAFANLDLSDLSELVIPSNIKSIGDYAFANTSIRELKLTEGIERIGKHAFANNRLTTISIPNTVTLVDDYAFYNNQIESIDLGINLKYIGTKAFSNNSIILELTIPENIETIGGNAFDYQSITEITINSPHFIIENGLLLTQDRKQVIALIDAYNWDFPEDSEEIGDYAFSNSELTSIIIPQ